MSAVDAVAGYPVHAVETFTKWTNQHGVGFTDWTAACGATGHLTGSTATFGKAGDALRKELCSTCFPGQRHSVYHPDPIEVPKESDEPGAPEG
jgi:hypothetical protein